MKKVARFAGRLGRIGIIGVAALAGCGGGDLGPMSGHQALPGRDFADVFFWKTRTLAFTRDTADPSQPEPQDLFVWPLDDASWAPTGASARPAASGRRPGRAARAPVRA